MSKYGDQMIVELEKLMKTAADDSKDETPEVKEVKVYSDILLNLSKLASKLDCSGDFKAADLVDDTIKKIAEEDYDWISEKQKLERQQHTPENYAEQYRELQKNLSDLIDNFMHTGKNDYRDILRKMWKIEKFMNPKDAEMLKKEIQSESEKHVAQYKKIKEYYNDLVVGVKYPPASIETYGRVSAAMTALKEIMDPKDIEKAEKELNSAV